MLIRLVWKSFDTNDRIVALAYLDSVSAISYLFVLVYMLPPNLLTSLNVVFVDSFLFKTLI